MRLFVKTNNPELASTVGLSHAEAVMLEGRMNSNPNIPDSQKEYKEEHDDPKLADFHLHAENPEISALLQEVGIAGMIHMAYHIDHGYSRGQYPDDKEYAKNIIQQCIANGGQNSMPFPVTTNTKMVEYSGATTDDSVLMDN